MSIKVSYSCNYIFGRQVLSERTRRKLLELGIEPSTVTSEAEAKILIENAQSKIKTLQQAKAVENKTVHTPENEIKDREDNQKIIFSMLDMSANLNKYILGL